MKHPKVFGRLQEAQWNLANRIARGKGKWCIEVTENGWWIVVRVTTNEDNNG